MKRIDKPWGYELIFAETEHYIGKILFIVRGKRLSLQFHKKKDETIFLFKGKMLLEVSSKSEPEVLESKVMKQGEAHRIVPGTIHRFHALENCEIFEVSTTESDDIVRLKDDYGRVM